MIVGLSEPEPTGKTPKLYDVRLVETTCCSVVE
jgi:hypothetical protein